MGFRPDRAYRIADERHRIFDGMGAYLNGARWNSQGRRIIYASDSFAGAMLEILVRARIGRMPRKQAWIEIQIPTEVSVEEVDGGDLPGWNEKDSAIARNFGDEWHRQGRSLILVVPSVTAAGIGHNVLINQDHVEFPLLRSTSPLPVVWDERLFPS
jgi:RES domain-containing protein